MPEIIIPKPSHIAAFETARETALPIEHLTATLAAADFLPSKDRQAPIFPAVLYGTLPKGKDEGFVDILPGRSDQIKRALDEPYFNPHDSVRSSASKLAKKMRGKGAYFWASSYVIGDSFYAGVPGANDDAGEQPVEDFLLQNPEKLKKLGESYNLGKIIIGTTVHYPERAETTLPAPINRVMRELGQTILKASMRTSKRKEMLEYAVQNWTTGTSPDWRIWRR